MQITMVDKKMDLFYVINWIWRESLLFLFKRKLNHRRVEIEFGSFFCMVFLAYRFCLFFI